MWFKIPYELKENSLIADDSYKMSNFIFFENKQEKNILDCHLLLLLLAHQG